MNYFINGTISIESTDQRLVQSHKYNLFMPIKQIAFSKILIILGNHYWTLDKSFLLFVLKATNTTKTNNDINKSGLGRYEIQYLLNNGHRTNRLFLNFLTETNDTFPRKLFFFLNLFGNVVSNMYTVSLNRKCWTPFCYVFRFVLKIY